MNRFRIVTAAILTTALLITAHTFAAPASKDKTLVVWTTLSNLTQHGGSALTVDDSKSHFDGIVFAEVSAKKWMAGSDFFHRTNRDQKAWPEESADANTVIQMAIVYSGKNVTIYRDGKEYSHYTAGGEGIELGANTAIVIGMRHLLETEADRFAGKIEDARVYNSALTADQIRALKPNVESDPKPWAWWTFDDKEAKEKAGRFVKVKLTGAAKIEDGKLILDGKSGFVATQSESAMAAASQPASAPPIPAGGRVSRETLAADPYRPTYHIVSNEGMNAPFDPNGGIFWKGRYHLMYIVQAHGHSWAHISSTDLVNWKHHPIALAPGNGDSGIFSGGIALDKNGVPTITYWGLGKPGGICVATATDDDLDHWTKNPANPVIKETGFGLTDIKEGDKEVMYGTADPSAIWIKDGKYYLLNGNFLAMREFGLKRRIPEHIGDTLYLFSSDDLTKWTYMHTFYKSDRKWTADNEDDMCPDFFPLPKSAEGGPPGDQHMILFLSHNRGCHYYLGKYADDHFTPATHGRMTNVDATVFAPESLVDAKGRRIMWAWIFDYRSPKTKASTGWSGEMCLPRVLWEGDDGTLRMKVAPELEQLRKDEQKLQNVAIAADKDTALEKISGNAIELNLELDPQDSKQCGVKVLRSPDGAEETLVYYDSADHTLNLDVTKSLGDGPKKMESAPFELKKGEKLSLRVFVDKSVVEAFANDRQAVLRRVYPANKESLGVSLFAHGGAATASQVTAWKMTQCNLPPDEPKPVSVAKKAPTSKSDDGRDIDDAPGKVATTKPVEEPIKDEWPITKEMPPALPKEFAYVFALPYGETDRYPTDPAKFEDMLIKLKGCGFNVVHCVYRDWRHELFKKHGMKMMVDVLAWKEGAESDIRREPQRPYVEDFIKRARDSDAIWGYNLWNERLDWCGDFKKLDMYVRMMRTWDPTHPVWVGTYRTMYSEHYATDPGCVAYYDYHWQRGLAYHFAHLRFYKALAEKRQSTIGMWEEVSDYPRIMYTLNTSIAYGTKTVMIFIGGPYDPRTGNCDMDNYLAKIGREQMPLYKLIGDMGRPTDVFSTPVTHDAANKEVKTVAIPSNTVAFPDDWWLKVKSGEVLCGFFKFADKSDVVYVANHNAYAEQDVAMTLSKERESAHVSRFDRATTKWVDLKPGEITFKLPPSGAEVLRFEGAKADAK